MEVDNIVTVKCMVYNHEPYLRQCLDGFVMQKTNFKFEVIVHDDASTDASAEIIKEYAEKYPSIIIPMYESENQYVKGGFAQITKIMDRYNSGKYIAICEGDDYWTDPYKLQKQVDYMEEHGEYGMVYTKSQVFMNDTGRIYTNESRQQDFVDILTNEDCIVTLTVCFRKQLYLDYINQIDVDCNWKMSDLPMWLYFSYHSKIKLMPTITGVYRFLPESASHSIDIVKKLSFSLSAFSVREFFAKKYHVEKYLKEIARFELNDLCKISIYYDRNISKTIFNFAYHHSLLDFRTLSKIFLYSTRVGRLYHQKKYGEKIIL